MPSDWIWSRFLGPQARLLPSIATCAMLGPTGPDQVRVNGIKATLLNKTIHWSDMSAAYCFFLFFLLLLTDTRHQSRSEASAWPAGATTNLTCNLCEAGTYWTASGWHIGAWGILDRVSCVSGLTEITRDFLIVPLPSSKIFPLTSTQMLLDCYL